MSKKYPCLRNFLRLLIFLGAMSHTTLFAADTETTYIRVTLGDYSYMPHEIKVKAGKPVVLQLVNTDLITPHNFILPDPEFGLDTNVDIPAGTTVEVQLNPQWPGSFTFYCDKRLPLMKSHREKGMEGKLIVEPSE